MRSPADLDTVPWHALTHAYGGAEDVPDLIRALYLDDEEAVAEAVDELWGTIIHQGTIYQASAPAVPFLAHAARHVPAKRDELLVLLALLAAHDPSDVGSPHWPDTAVAAVCAELCRVLPDLLPCLTDGERVVRRAALRVVAAVADVLPADGRASVAGLVDGLYRGDPVPAVRADAMVALTALGQRVAALDDGSAEVRLAGALLAAERCEPPYPSELVAVIAADGAAPDPGDDELPWSDGSTQDERLTRLLTRDPDAALSVAARWIEAGDLGSRGSWLAGEVAEHWRDREAVVLDLLLAALPRQRDAGSVGARLRTIGHWAELLPAPGADLRDALHRYAADSGAETADSALRALVRTRDPRALELVLRRPDGQLLKAAALAFPGAGARLIPVIRRQLAAGATANDGIALVLALEPLGAGAREAQDELVDCVRTGRAAIVAARQLGRTGVPTPEAVELLGAALQSGDASVRSAAAGAHYRLTGEPDRALRTFGALLSEAGQHSWYLGDLEPLGSAAAGLLPLIEPMLESGYEWTRMAAARAHSRITGSTERAVPVLAELVGPTPVGVRALDALAEIGEVPAELDAALARFARSGQRLYPDSPFAGPDHLDEELRALARRLLADASTG
ncbi:hypothetical protein ACFW1A_34135 [Kitasatospora sp. NPDC058965]|uniref:hypothetical protein n=1 Tax=Kitasatospora sp. NPDC058965 TaxID=3346682 RepID=UPI00367F383E